MDPPGGGRALRAGRGVSEGSREARPGSRAEWRRQGGAAESGEEPRDSRPIASVYVHAPFCARRCGYCDFAVQVRRVGDAEAWALALAGELSAVRDEATFQLAPRLRSLYVGGGTPSLLGADAMDRLAHVIGRERLQGEDLEWTAEANPESFTDDVAEGWSRAGVNRVSLGVQSFDERVLRWMGRLHGPAGAVDAVERARRAGITNLSVDLIFALPATLERSWTDDLERTLALGVPHVSLYGLTVEPETPLGRRVREGRDPPVDEGRYREEFLEAAEKLAAAGYLHYEVSNFALPGRESRHNGVYWTGEPYLGLGNSAHSYVHPLRRWNLRDWNAYERAAREGRLAVQDQEVLDARATRLERVWLGLRTQQGLGAPELSPRGHLLVEQWAHQGWADWEDGVVRLTPQGWLLLDRLAVELDSALDPGIAWTPETSSAKPART
jgi:oxygen-independent coproporphyrinogen III oxidase